MMLSVTDDVSRLILACARAARDVTPTEIVDRASAIGDWEQVITTASAHSLLPLLALRLAEAGVGVPTRVR